jgi:hypothetical protein
VLCNTPPYDESYYFKFKKLLTGSLQLLSRVEIYGLFNTLEAFCLRKINSGNSKYVDELFEVFTIEIERGFYKYSDSSPVTYMKFRNTYLSALSLKKFDWAQEFILKFKNDLIEPDRENILKVALAQLDFEKGNYENVLTMLSELKSDSVYSKIDMRNLTIMSYYELGYTESVLSAIDSYRHFLSTNKSLTDVFRESHLRFINSLGTFILAKDKPNKSKLEELRNFLLTYRNDRRIGWLIDKIDLC